MSICPSLYWSTFRERTLPSLYSRPIMALGPRASASARRRAYALGDASIASSVAGRLARPSFRQAITAIQGQLAKPYSEVWVQVSSFSRSGSHWRRAGTRNTLCRRSVGGGVSGVAYRAGDPFDCLLHFNRTLPAEIAGVNMCPKCKRRLFLSASIAPRDRFLVSLQEGIGISLNLPF